VAYWRPPSGHRLVTFHDSRLRLSVWTSRSGTHHLWCGVWNDGDLFGWTPAELTWVDECRPVVPSIGRRNLVGVKAFISSGPPRYQTGKMRSVHTRTVMAKLVGRCSTTSAKNRRAQLNKGMCIWASTCERYTNNGQEGERRSSQKKTRDRDEVASTSTRHWIPVSIASLNDYR
jgi:hypothetical protein